MMKAAALAFLLAVVPGATFAASAEDPVRNVISVLINLRSEKPVPGTDYFDRSHLNRYYSREFIAAYRAAAKFPAYPDAGSPWDYDVITTSQGGCPLKDVTVDIAGRKSGITVVKLTFRMWDCSSIAQQRAKVNEVHFDVITEDGRAVIADIHRIFDGKADSLLQEMRHIAWLGTVPE